MGDANVGSHLDTFSSPTSITITHHTERSWRSFLLQSILRPFKHRIFKPGEPHDPGSPQLTPHKACTKVCTVTERQVDGIYTYDVTAPHKSVELGSRLNTSQIQTHNTRVRIYYIAGGSWRGPPSPDHWKFAAKLVSELQQTTVTIISVPLAPHETAPTVFPKLLSMYEQVMSESKSMGEKVIWAGDSSGGNIVLGLVGEALKLGSTSQESGLENRSDFATIEQHPVASRKGMYPMTLPAPLALLLISPSVNGKRDNPDIAKVEKYDPILVASVSAKFAADWAGEWPLDDERISPGLDEGLGKLLSERGVKVHGITAGYDL